MKKKAYVLIKVAAGKLDHILRHLSSMPQVDSAEGVSGHCDVVAIIRGPDLETLQDTILSTVRGIDGIESTETWIVMVPQPETWTEDELRRYVGDCNESELAAFAVLLEKGRSMMTQELVDAIAGRLGDDDYDIHSATVTLTGMTRRASDHYRRENLIEFDDDMGYFLVERYIEQLSTVLGERGLELETNKHHAGEGEVRVDESEIYRDDKSPL